MAIAYSIVGVYGNPSSDPDQRLGEFMPTWLLIIFIVFLALSPLLALMPTRRQRQVAGLRQMAALAGLRVQLRAPPGAAGEQGLVACYSLPVAAGQYLQQVGGYRNTGAEWQRLDPLSGALPARLLAELPRGVSHLLLVPEQVAVFWDERGSNEDIQRIKQVLEAILLAFATDRQRG